MRIVVAALLSGISGSCGEYAPRGTGPRAKRDAAPQLEGISPGDETDTLTLMMLSDALQDDALDVKVLSGALRITDVLAAVQNEKPDVVCIAGIPPYVALRARHLTQRIRAANASVPLVLGLWSAESRPRLHEKLKADGADWMAASVQEAAEAVRTLTRKAGTSAAALS